MIPRERRHVLRKRITDRPASRYGVSVLRREVHEEPSAHKGDIARNKEFMRAGGSETKFSSSATTTIFPGSAPVDRHQFTITNTAGPRFLKYAVTNTNSFLAERAASVRIPEFSRFYRVRPTVSTGRGRYWPRADDVAPMMVYRSPAAPHAGNACDWLFSITTRFGEPAPVRI